MSQIWMVMIAVGLLTYATRLSFTLLLEHWQPPQVVQRALRYVPVAVLTAIFLPDILTKNNVVDISLGNPRLIAGLIAILVAWRSKSALWTIAAGMAAFLILNWVF